MTPQPVKRIGTGPLRLGILTSIETRHRYFARALDARLQVASVVYARPTYFPAHVDDSELTDADRSIVARHFVERAEEEEAFFGHNAEFLTGTQTRSILQVGPGQLNTSEVVQSLRTAGANTIAVFGTDLIKPPLLAPQLWTMINMHLGLSPYYRGTATNFYPLLNGEPEYIGATIHLLDHGIDSGPILEHARPVIEENDRPHSLGCKAIASGIEAMVQVLTRLNRGEAVTAVPQWKEPRSKVYYRRDYHPRDVVEMYRKWDAGLLRKALAKKCPAPRLVQNGIMPSAGNPVQQPLAVDHAPLS